MIRITHGERRWALWILLTAIVCVTVLELVAMHRGVDGVALSATVGVIGTIVGVTAAIVGIKLHRIVW